MINDAAEFAQKKEARKRKAKEIRSEGDLIV